MEDRGHAALAEESLKRRVHAILYTQFLIIFKMVAVFVWVPSFSDHAHNNLWMFWVCLGLMYALMNALISCDNLRTKYIVAIVLAICEAYMLGILSTLHQEKELVIATAATAMLTLVFTASAFRNELNITQMRSIVLALILTILIMFWTNAMINLMYASLGALQSS
ncbi:protein lifeguard 1 isoform X1 [Penaeus vannamei]|uniref:protein lifeguard 1 isoform X1 n=1 Tax=Penaeus vannamei TaxID=6689 RepID=UPI00387F6B53